LIKYFSIFKHSTFIRNIFSVSNQQGMHPKNIRYLILSFFLLSNLILLVSGNISRLKFYIIKLLIFYCMYKCSLNKYAILYIVKLQFFFSTVIISVIQLILLLSFFLFHWVFCLGIRSENIRYSTRKIVFPDIRCYILFPDIQYPILWSDDP